MTHPVSAMQDVPSNNHGGDYGAMNMSDEEGSQIGLAPSAQEEAAPACPAEDGLEHRQEMGSSADAEEDSDQELVSAGTTSSPTSPGDDHLPGLTRRLPGYPEISCDLPPWEEPRPSTEDECITIGEFIEQRNPTRQDLWAVVQLALSGTVADERLFQSSGSGACFTLQPKIRSTIPLQRIHVGPYAIPDSVADISTATITSSHLLSLLNFILDTTYVLEYEDGLEDLLDYIRSKTKDVGEAYGFLRRWWSDGDFSDIYSEVKTRKTDVSSELRRTLTGSCIENPRQPPRRLWDLYSNRVLPWSLAPRSGEILDPDMSDDRIYWTVSHSWAAEDQRKEVWTKINGELRPVSIPRDTTLEHVRVELLNMGAEFVWLDTLCLRQKGKAEYEALRIEEWKIDVPTIGSVFFHRRCVMYFNGLGIPFDPSPAVVQSTRHWFNRVWTMQETQEPWLPGGLTGQPREENYSFFTRLANLISIISLPSRHFEVMREISARHCTNPLDRIAGLAYYLRCGTLPVYHENISEEAAWSMLIKHMHDWFRTQVFLQYTVDEPFGSWVTWKGFMEFHPAIWHGQEGINTSSLEDHDYLTLLDPNMLYTDEPATYYHSGILVRPCFITLAAYSDESRPQEEANDEELQNPRQSVELMLEGLDEPFSFVPEATHGILLPDVPYTLVGVGTGWKDYWVAVEHVGERQIVRETGFRSWERVLAAEVVKWAVIRVEQQTALGIQALAASQERQFVMYVDGEEARTRSRYTERYLAAFGKTKEAGGTNSGASS